MTSDVEPIVLEIWEVHFHYSKVDWPGVRFPSMDQIALSKNYSYSVWFEFYGISTFVGYLMPNPFLYMLIVLF